MTKELSISIESLQDGEEHKIEAVVPSSELFFPEKDLNFADNVSFQVRYYLAQDHLILSVDAHAEAFFPCAICNAIISLPIILSQFYHAEPISSRTSYFDIKPLITELLLLQVPQFAECQGNC
ncbi:MAG: hypothetical protein FJZ63_07440, partial [Chlamydiae bacterium]|nr:hypothetical protein [Chlamydiota bacterium]